MIRSIPLNTVRASTSLATSKKRPKVVCLTKTCKACKTDLITILRLRSVLKNSRVCFPELGAWLV